MGTSQPTTGYGRLSVPRTVTDVWSAPFHRDIAEGDAVIDVLVPGNQTIYFWTE